MKYLQKLHNRRVPPGRERSILRRLPVWLLGGTMVPLLMSLIVRLIPAEGGSREIAKQYMSVDILAIAIGITAWTAVLTIAIGCVIVIIMKGPAYVADAYSMERPEKPESNRDE